MVRRVFEAATLASMTTELREALPFKSAR
jgi:hypothetical protein